MENKEFAIKYKNKIYYLDKRKLKFILEKITNTKINTENFYTIKKIFKKYLLYDEVFLNTIKSN